MLVPGVVDARLTLADEGLMAIIDSEDACIVANGYYFFMLLLKSMEAPEAQPSQHEEVSEVEVGSPERQVL